MEFYDYKTLPVSGDQVIDSTKTGMSFYDQFLTKQEEHYLHDVKNLKGEIVLMSPEEYYDACAKYGFPNSPVSVENLKRTRRAQTKILDHLKEVLLSYKKRFPMPMLNIAQKGQEGLHRMMVVGDLFGWDHKVPVLVVTHYDEARAKREEEERFKYDIDRNVEKAIRLASQFTYYSVDELEQQLLHDIANRFEYRDDIQLPSSIEIQEAPDAYTFTLFGFQYSIDKDDITMRSQDELDDITIEDQLDDDFLARYFGDNWEDDFPELRTKFNIDESFNQNNKLNMMEFFRTLLAELAEFDYAFIDGEGKELDEEDAMEAVVQSPEQLADLGKGVCTDFVEYTRAKLDERNIPYKVYDIACTDKDGDHPAHVFVVVEHGGRFLWLEAAWYSEAGIHEYDSLEALFEDIARKHCIYDGKNYLESCEIREIKKSLVGMSQEAIYDYVDTLPITWKAAEEGITESFEKEIGLVFLSDKNMNGKTLTPRVPNNFLIKNGYEDNVTPRICFAGSIDKALMAISRNLMGEELFVHHPKSINKKAIYKPSIKEVPDVKITGEIWYKEPVELQCIGKILVTADDGKDGHKYTYGDNTAELYGWRWEWVAHSPVNESIEDEVRSKFVITSDVPEGPSFILRNGDFVDIAKSFNENSFEDYPVHAEVDDYLYSIGMIDTRGDYTDGSPALQSTGVVRLNDVEEENNYIELPKEPLTSEQYKSIMRWLDVNPHSYVVILTYGMQNEARYDLNDVDYIIKRIKRYYASGKLYEKLK